MLEEETFGNAHGLDHEHQLDLRHSQSMPPIHEFGGEDIIIEGSSSNEDEQEDLDHVYNRHMI